MSRLTHPSQTYTMPSGVPFLSCLATGLAEHFGDNLSDALILLPTRRAVRGLGDAFVESGALGRRATLLPQMRPIADIDSDDISYEPGELLLGIAPAISPLQRRFEIARVITLYHRRTSDLPLTASSALALADPLCEILDDAAMEEASLPNHERLEEIRALAAQHFQHASVFYEIIQRFWPDRLRELGLSDPKLRQVQLLDALRAEWEANPPQHPVIIAGSTGTLKAVARLIATIRTLPKGLVVLPGVDMNLREDEAWDNVDAQHPQGSLRTLLGTMGLDRADIGVWPVTTQDSAQLTARRRVISEALVPVSAAQDWPARIAQLKSQGINFAAAVNGLSLIEARHDEEESLAIALILREALETPDRTASLVTPDSGLARRVRTRLARWGITIDYSQGQPLEESALGAYLVGLLKLAGDMGSAVDLAYVLKHPLTALKKSSGDIHNEWLAIEPKFRGDVPSEDALAKIDALTRLTRAMEHLTDMKTATPDGWARALSRTAEALAETDTTPGAARLWTGESGEEAARFIEDLIQYGDLAPPIDATGFHDLLLSLMRERVVRSVRGTHPRLSILGPLEARMQTADVLVLGGLNEGTWPAIPSPTPFLSREMRRALGLSLPERRFGLSAHDFAQAAAHPNVILTRSERTGEGPAVASRWVWRLKTLLRGALGDGENGWDSALKTDQPYLAWARQMDVADTVTAAQRPMPTPPLDARWPKGRTLSITRIKTWVRDPYAIYCREVLGLKPLDPLGAAIGIPEYGSAIHKGLEDFYAAYPDSIPDHANLILTDMLEQALLAQGFPETDLAKERPRLSRLSDKVVAWIAGRRDAGWRFVGSELWGELNLTDLDFTLTGRADLIEAGPTGYAVIDFKTGSGATHKEVAAGFDPQLPLTALMLAEGAVKGTGPGDTDDLIYGIVKGYTDGDITSSIIDKGKLTATELRNDARDNLTQLIQKFDEADTPYPSQPRRKYTNDYGDYDDLARRGEWAQAGDDSPGEGA